MQSFVSYSLFTKSVLILAIISQAVARLAKCPGKVKPWPSSLRHHDMKGFICIGVYWCLISSDMWSCYYPLSVIRDSLITVKKEKEKEETRSLGLPRARLARGQALLRLLVLQGFLVSVCWQSWWSLFSVILLSDLKFEIWFRIIKPISGKL